jgi:hypothetical protein
MMRNYHFSEVEARRLPLRKCWAFYNAHFEATAQMAFDRIGDGYVAQEIEKTMLHSLTH